MPQITQMASIPMRELRKPERAVRTRAAEIMIKGMAIAFFPRKGKTKAKGSRETPRSFSVEKRDIESSISKAAPATPRSSASMK